MLRLFVAKISIRLAKSAVKSFYQKTFADDRVGANRAETRQSVE